jgi:mediator of replication checkpoint protein 1
MSNYIQFKHRSPRKATIAAEPFSPAARAMSPSQFELTPRSKVKALLASLDNDSDEENDSGSARARLVSAFTKPSTSSEACSKGDDQPLRKTSGHTIADELEKDSDDDKEEDIVRPEGQLAARMLETEDNSDRDGKPAADKSPEIAKSVTKSTSSISHTNTDDSEENEASVVSRKRKVRVPRRGTLESSPRNRTTSPGLFVSPSANRSATTFEDDSDSEELPANPLANDRFKALVEKKRLERLVKDKEAAAEKAKKLAERKSQNEMLEDDEDISDDNVERRLTQQAKPTRKASKKALEEMHRETQRLSRNMQLAHNAMTKKKITKASLFVKFNYKPTGFVEEDTTESARPTSSSSVAPHSDIEMRETPPTSPASRASDVEKSAIVDSEPSAFAEIGGEENEEEDLPELQHALKRLASSPLRILDEGKGKAFEVDKTLLEPPMPLFKQPLIRIRPPKMANKKVTALDDSDSDLEIVSAKTPNAKTKKLDSIFDRVPAKQAKESSSLHALRMLAHLTSPGKQNLQKNKKPSMTTIELQLSLQQRARQQATREREERLQALRDKGVIAQTAEEREKEMAEVEDLISKARREGEEIMKREKAAAKKEQKANGEVDPLGDSSDDEDWAEEKESLAEELSGSEGDDEEGSENDGSEASGEDEDDEDEENEMALDDAEPTEATPNALFDDEVGETDNDEAEAEAEAEDDLPMGEQMAEAGADDDEVEEDAEEHLPAHKQRRSRKTNVISDDEDEENPAQETPSAPRTKSSNQLHTDSPGAPNSVLRSATKTFIPGLTVAGPAGLGLTQIFAGTMDESQMDTSHTMTNSESQEQDYLAFLRRRPAPELPDFVPTMEEDTQDQDVVMDSQSGITHVPESQAEESHTQAIQLQFSQSQIHDTDNLVQDPIATQFSEMPEATQDAGFKHMTPIRGRFAEAPPSTIDTVMLDPVGVSEPMEETPTLRKKGKLRRRGPQVATFSDDEDLAERDEVEAEVEVEAAEDLNITANVFDVMRKASKKKVIVVDEFDKKKSKAKEMVHEQADESEDEYAGLGGASDDESGDEEDEYVKAIIDDEGGKDVDESKLAAFFAYVFLTYVF